MVDNVYGGVSGNSTHGQNTQIHFYDKAGIKAANEMSVYSQFADRKYMPTKRGMTYKTSKWLHIYDREVISADFDKYGYLTGRNVADVESGLADATLPEGSGPANKRSIKKVTVETSFARYGEMLDYSDEVEMFSEDAVQVHYHEELGRLANIRNEDLVQLEMLSTTTVLYPGTATSPHTVGIDTTAADGSEDGLSRYSYDLSRRATMILDRNRAVKNTEIVDGDVKVDTRTVNKAYYAIVGAQVKFDLPKLTRGDSYEKEFVYIPTSKYASGAKDLAKGEVGAMDDTRFIESETAVVYRGAGAQVPSGYVGTLSTTTLDAPAAAALEASLGSPGVYNAGETRFDVFPILYPTQGSFATVGLKGKNKIVFHKMAPGELDRTNPYANQGFFSYNFWYAGLIQREERLLKVMVAASA